MKCPKCGAELLEKSGRYGRFLGCSNWPRCDGSRDLKETDNSTTTKPRRRRGGLRVIFPESISPGFRQKQPPTYQLKIYRHDEAQATDSSSLASEAL
jgi:ssDNA-binding Zn-finger/Zn-ribbon topoisomerase 1